MTSTTEANKTEALVVGGVKWGQYEINIFTHNNICLNRLIIKKYV